MLIKRKVILLKPLRRWKSRGKADSRQQLAVQILRCEQAQEIQGVRCIIARSAGFLDQLKCYLKEKILELTKKVIICRDHKFDNKAPHASNNGKMTPSVENGESSKKKKTKELTQSQLKVPKE